MALNVIFTITVPPTSWSSRYPQLLLELRFHSKKQHVGILVLSASGNRNSMSVQQTKSDRSQLPCLTGFTGQSLPQEDLFQKAFIYSLLSTPLPTVPPINLDYFQGSLPLTIHDQISVSFPSRSASFLERISCEQRHVQTQRNENG